MSEFAVPHKTSTGDSLRIDSLDLTLRVSRGGYIPRSGLYLAEHLSRRGVRGEGLDVGTGDTGLLAYCMERLGAQRVVACDIDPRAIECAQMAGSSQTVEWLVSDVFTAIPKNYRFDLIVSNPPQLPMPTPGTLHDYGGPDGRATILKLVSGAHGFLKKNGSLVMLCFDFLGIDERWGKAPSLKEIAAEHSFNLKVITQYKRSVRPGGQTEQHLPWINAMYPLYQFKEDQENNPFHLIEIVELKREKK